MLCSGSHKFGVPTSNQTNINLVDSFMKINTRGMGKDKEWTKCPCRRMLLTQQHRRSSNDRGLWKPDPLTMHLGYTRKDERLENIARCKDIGVMEMFIAWLWIPNCLYLSKLLGCIQQRVLTAMYQKIINKVCLWGEQIRIQLQLNTLQITAIPKDLSKTLENSVLTGHYRAKGNKNFT